MPINRVSKFNLLKGGEHMYKVLELQSIKSNEVKMEKTANSRMSIGCGGQSNLSWFAC